MYNTVGNGNGGGGTIPISVPTCGVGGKVYNNSGPNLTVYCPGFGTVVVRAGGWVCNLDTGIISVFDPDTGTSIHYSDQWIYDHIGVPGIGSGGNSGAGQGFAALSYFFGW